MPKIKIPVSVAVKNACANPGPAVIYCKNMKQVQKVTKYVTKYGRMYRVFAKKNLPKEVIVRKTSEAVMCVLILPTSEVKTNEPTEQKPRLIRSAKGLFGI